MDDTRQSLWLALVDLGKSHGFRHGFFAIGIDLTTEGSRPGLGACRGELELDALVPIAQGIDEILSAIFSPNGYLARRRMSAWKGAFLSTPARGDK